MPSELSMPMRDEAGQPVERESMIVSSGSKIEERIVQWLCQPVLGYIPRSVHPNTISLLTHTVCWTTAILAIGSVRLPQPYKSLALAFAGVCMLLSMIGDCLDGMHARNTNQCSKLGEMMDHWLDAIIVPLVVLGASTALEMEPWAIATVNVTATMVYHGQLVLYHHTGKFVHPEPATGMEAQFALSIGYVGIAALLYFVDRHQPWLDVAMALLALLALFVQARCNWFYYVRLGKLLRYHLLFVVMCSSFGLLYFVDRHQPWLDVAIGGIALLALFIQARCNMFYYVRLGKLLRYHLLFVVMCSSFGLLYWIGAIDTYAFAFGLTLVSFRIAGTYVLFTIVRRRYDGNDWGVLAWLAAMFAGHFMAPIAVGPFTLQALLPYFTCVYMVGRNLLDFSQYYRVLKPSVT